jgi:small conductance mechanosensitive channel
VETQFSAFLAAWVVPVVKAVLIIAVGFWGSGVAGKFAVRQSRNAKFTEALARFLGQGTRYLILSLAVITAASEVGIETTSLVALLGSAGIALGLALQGTLSHFASGVMLLIFRPFDIDDRVTVAGHTGLVEEVGLFATTLITPAHETIVIPNGSVAAASIVNHTRRGKMRGSVSVGVAYGADVAQVIDVLENAAKSVDTVLSDPGVGVGFVDLGASSLDFTVFFHVLPADFVATTGNVRKAVYDSLNDAAIDIPYQTIVIQQAAPEPAPAEAVEAPSGEAVAPVDAD